MYATNMLVDFWIQKNAAGAVLVPQPAGEQVVVRHTCGMCMRHNASGFRHNQRRCRFVSQTVDCDKELLLWRWYLQYQTRNRDTAIVLVLLGTWQSSRLRTRDEINAHKHPICIDYSMCIPHVCFHWYPSKNDARFFVSPMHPQVQQSSSICRLAHVCDDQFVPTSIKSYTSLCAWKVLPCRSYDLLVLLFAESSWRWLDGRQPFFPCT